MNSFRRQDVTTFAIGILDQRNMRAAIRIVLQSLNNAWNTIFVAFEIDNAVALFMAAALVTHRDAAIIIATTFRRFFVEKRTVRLAFMQARRFDLDDKTASS